MQRKATRSFVMLMMLGVLAASQGCSIGKALTGPPPIEVEKVKVGETREAIIALLGNPKITENAIDSRTDRYEFIDGYPGAAKARVILYIAGDFFTCGLSELLFWPIELVADGGIRGRAVVKYGLDDISQSVLLTKADGSQWVYATEKIVEQKSTAGVSPYTQH